MNVNMFHFYFSRNNVITSLKEINNRNSTIKVSFKIVVENLMQWTAKKCTLMILSYLNDGYIMTIVRSTRFKNCLHLDVFMYHSSVYSGRHEN